MNTVLPSSLLSFSLRLDAAISLASGVLLCTRTEFLSHRFDLEFGLLLGAGLFCLPYAAMLMWMASRQALSSAAVLFIVVGNLLWADAALLLALGYGAEPNGWGQAYLATHVLATSGFALLQWLGWRRSTRIHVGFALN